METLKTRPSFSPANTRGLSREQILPGVIFENFQAVVFGRAGTVFSARLRRRGCVKVRSLDVRRF